MKPATFLAFLLLLCAMAAVPAQAQTVVNPRTVEFDPSADHNAVTTGGQAVVQRYDLQIYTLSATTPYTTGNLGKPAPQSDGKIRVDFSTLVTPWPLPDGTYDARVVAVGPTGTAPSDVSNTFAFQSQSCTYTLGSPSQAFSSGGGTGSVTVSAGTNCAWTVASDSTWVMLGTTSGSGNGTVNFTVATNLGATARSATLTIGGKTFLITQGAPVSCSYSISPNSLTFTNVGGGGNVTVSTANTCSWTSSGAPSWLHFSTSSGTGPGAASFNVDANTGTQTRTASLTIAGQAVSVTQTAPAPCTYSISPGSQGFTENGGSVSVAVTAGTGCAWTASSPVTWATVSASSGSGNGGVTVTVGANTSTASRSTTVTIAGRSFSVTQSGLPCSYSISPASTNLTSDGGSVSVAVTAGTGCAWTASSPVTWATLSASSGSGNGGVTVTVGANTSTASRSTSVTIAGRSFSVTQSGLTCSYSITPASRNFGADGGSVSVSVTAGSGCSWTAASSDTWATLVGSGGTGNGSVTVNVTANGTTAARSTTLTIAGQPFAVTESGITCSYSISPASQDFTEAGGAGSFTVTSASACAWTATSSAPTWLAVTSGGNGSGGGTIGFSVAPNTLTAPRTATISAGGQVFTVTQAAVACSYVLSSTGQNFTSAGGTGTVGVTAGVGCSWSAASNAGWLHVTAGGSGNGTVSFSVDPNSTTGARSGALTVAGKLFTVTQDALSCSFSVTPASETFAATAATASVTVGGPTACGWTATNSASWVTLGATTGNGGALVPITVAANPNATPRSASLTIAGQPFTVTQSAGGCSYTLSPTASTQFGQGGGSGSFSVSCGSGCTWKASSSDTWVTLTTTGGSGTGTVAFTVAKNTTTSPRTTKITVEGQVYTVTQAAATRPSKPKKPRITSVIGG